MMYTTKNGLMCVKDWDIILKLKTKKLGEKKAIKKNSPGSLLGYLPVK